MATTTRTRKKAARRKYTGVPALPSEGSRQFCLISEMAKNSRRWVHAENSTTTEKQSSIVDDISRLRAKGWNFEEKILDNETGRRAYRLDQEIWAKLKGRIERFW